jgi:hypothetical protein
LFFLLYVLINVTMIIVIFYGINWKLNVTLSLFTVLFISSGLCLFCFCGCVWFLDHLSWKLK